MPEFTYEYNDEKGSQLWEVECEYAYTKGEKAVHYYRDGSGYPGSPDEVELLGFTVIRHEVFVGDPETTGKWVNQPIGADKDKAFWNVVQADDNLREKFEELAFEDAAAADSY